MALLDLQMMKTPWDCDSMEGAHSELSVLLCEDPLSNISILLCA
ncbi:SapB/AmfS family lanthipeptide [Streptomyces lavendofoliae]